MQASVVVWDTTGDFNLGGMRALLSLYRTHSGNMGVGPKEDTEGNIAGGSLGSDLSWMMGGSGMRGEWLEEGRKYMHGMYTNVYKYV